jgi:hypothetical protein
LARHRDQRVHDRGVRARADRERVDGYAVAGVDLVRGRERVDRQREAGARDELGRHGQRQVLAVEARDDVGPATRSVDREGLAVAHERLAPILELDRRVSARARGDQVGLDAAAHDDRAGRGRPPRDHEALLDAVLAHVVDLDDRAVVAEEAPGLLRHGRVRPGSSSGTPFAVTDSVRQRSGRFFGRLFPSTG